jgi:hypothetical protein
VQKWHSLGLTALRCRHPFRPPRWRHGVRIRLGLLVRIYRSKPPSSDVDTTEMARKVVNGEVLSQSCPLASEVTIAVTALRPRPETSAS